MDHEDWVVVFDTESFAKAKEVVREVDARPNSGWFCRLPYLSATATARRWVVPPDTYRAKVFRAPRET